MMVEGRDLRAVWWEGDEADGAVHMIDQRLLPHRLETVVAQSVDEVAHHIRDMTVRGAPTIGATAAYGMVLGREDPVAAAAILAASRPTAQDLFTALEWMKTAPTLARAAAYVDDLVARCRLIGTHGARLFEEVAGGRDTVRALTHCHAGALATVDHGTALAPIHALMALGGRVRPFVWVDETRPRVQGAITAWELRAAGVPHRVLVDNAAPSLMARGEVDLVVVGADRIAANGDVVNKIGTYGKALAAAAHGVPFYVAAPVSTFDFSLPTGAAVPIEERPVAEVLEWAGHRVYGSGTEAVNPAFDVTPSALVTGYITEFGILGRDRLGMVRAGQGMPLPPAV